MYDINKIKRIGHGDVFSKGNTPQGTRNKIPNSTNSIPNSYENVNNDVSYSAKKSDTVQRITENFGYSDVTANSIYKAARTLRQNTASKADTVELAYTIAITLKIYATATPTRAMLFLISKASFSVHYSIIFSL